MLDKDPGTEITTYNELSLKDVILGLIKWFNFLLSKWFFIVTISIVCGAIGLGYAFYKKPLYKADLSFALEDAKSGGTNPYSGLASQFGLDLGGNGGGAFSGDNLMELMRSRTMIQKTLLTPVDIHGKIETLAELYIDFNSLREAWKKNPDLAHVTFLPGLDTAKLTLTQDSLISTFHKNLIASNLTVDKVDKKLSIIVVTVRSSNELFSKYFTEILANRVSQFFIETKTKKSAQNVRILQHQTDSVRHELNGDIGNVASSIDATPNANPNRVILRTSSQRHQIDVETNKSILAELVKNLEAAKVSLRNETPLIQIIDQPILPLDVEKIGKIKSALIGLILGGFLGVLGLISKRTYKAVMS